MTLQHFYSGEIPPEQIELLAQIKGKVNEVTQLEDHTHKARGSFIELRDKTENATTELQQLWTQYISLVERHAREVNPA